MACGKPLLVCSPADTPIVNFLENLDCAKIITAHNPTDKAAEVVQWIESVTPETLKQMGENGLDIIHKSFSKGTVTKRYAELLENL